MVQWHLKKVKGGYIGTIRCTDQTGGIVVTRKAKTKENSILQAAGIAAAAADNPILASVLPPGTATSIRAVGEIAAAVKKGQAGKALKKYAGKGARRLIKTLKFW